MSEKYIRVSDIPKVSSPSHDYGVPQFTAEEIAKSIGAEPKATTKYKPVCKYGTRHCIHDPAYIKYRQSLFGRLSNDDSEELMQSDWCAECDNRDEYDDEDK